MRSITNDFRLLWPHARITRRDRTGRLPPGATRMKFLKKRIPLGVCAALALAALGTTLSRQQPQEVPAPGVKAAGVNTYEAQVRPFLEKYCLECHGGEKPK